MTKRNFEETIRKSRIYFDLGDFGSFFSPNIEGRIFTEGEDAWVEWEGFYVPPEKKPTPIPATLRKFLIYKGINFEEKYLFKFAIIIDGKIEETNMSYF